MKRTRVKVFLIILLIGITLLFSACRSNAPFDSQQQEQFAQDFFKWRIAHDFNAFVNIKTYTILINVEEEVFNKIITMNNNEVIKYFDLQSFNTSELEYVYVVINSKYMLELKTGEIWT